MRIYRISSSEYINDLSGTGAKLFGGRWNDIGTALLYSSENVSLAILEILVHFDGFTVPNNLELLYLDIDEKLVNNFSISKFNKIRKSDKAEYDFKLVGQNWIKSKKSLALKVPSIIVKNEFNILINPNHEDFNKLKKVKKEELDLDERLFNK